MPKLSATVDEWLYAEFLLRANQLNLYKPDLLREIVTAYLVAPRPYPDLVPDSRNAQTEHLSVRLPMFLADAVRQRAADKGMSASRWKAALIQSHLMRAPVFTESQIADLRASNYELRMIGINLNQIAHALNIRAEETERVKLEIIQALVDKITAHRQMVARLIRHSQNDWAAD